MSTYPEDYPIFWDGEGSNSSFHQSDRPPSDADRLGLPSLQSPEELDSLVQVLPVPGKELGMTAQAGFVADLVPQFVNIVGLATVDPEQGMPHDRLAELDRLIGEYVQRHTDLKEGLLVKAKGDETIFFIKQADGSKAPLEGWMVEYVVGTIDRVEVRAMPKKEHLETITDPMLSLNPEKWKATLVNAQRDVDPFVLTVVLRNAELSYGALSVAVESPVSEVFVPVYDKLNLSPYTLPQDGDTPVIYDDTQVRESDAEYTSAPKLLSEYDLLFVARRAIAATKAIAAANMAPFEDQFTDTDPSSDDEL